MVERIIFNVVALALFLYLFFKYSLIFLPLSFFDIHILN